MGLLVMKKRLLRNVVPAEPGGGVVFFVDSRGHSYIQNSEDREEAGTPDIVGCIRTGEGEKGLRASFRSCIPPAYAAA